MKKNLFPLILLFLIISCEEERVITEISFENSEYTISVDQELQLNVLHSPSNFEPPDYTFSVSNSSIATVNENGVIKGISPGETGITVRARDIGLNAFCSIIVDPILSTNITFENNNIELKIGYDTTIMYTIAPENTTDQSVTWSSLNSSIATVDGQGTITGINFGTTKVIATLSSSSVSDTCIITVVPISVEGVSLVQTFEVIQGRSVQIVPIFTPSDASYKDVTWSMLDESIASIDNDGYVTGITVGSTSLQVTTNEGDFTASCQVNVLPIPVDSITISTKCNIVVYNRNLQLEAIVYPSNAANKNIVWSSSNESVATVNSTGVVTGHMIGPVTITASTEEGSIIDTKSMYVFNLTDVFSLSHSSGGVAVINGYVTGTVYSYITNNSMENVTLTKFEIIDSSTGIVKVSSTSSSLLGGLSYNETKNLGGNLNSVYLPYFKWYFDLDGEHYSVMHQYSTSSYY